MKIPAEAPEGSVRFRRVPVQVLGEVPEGYGGADMWLDSKWFLVQVPGEVPELSSAAT